MWAQVATIIAAACVFAWTPPGTFVRTHIGGQLPQLVEIVRARPTREEIRLATLGDDYRFVAFVRDATPTDAVILMSDDPRGSRLDPKQGKNREWMTYFLHPRTVLYLSEQSAPAYRQATHMLVDGAPSIQWMAPELRDQIETDRLSCVPFDMNAYLTAIEVGEVPRTFLPPATRIAP